MRDWFAQYTVDVHSPGAGFRLALALRTHGVATFTGVTTRYDLLRVARDILSITPHRDADAHGITEIAQRDSISRRPGFAGFGTDHLRPHTEATACACPPAALMLVCGVPAETGGESQLVDGSRVYDTLTRADPGLLAALSMRRSALFGGSGGHTGSVFTPIDDGRVMVRFRDDALVQFHPEVAGTLPELRRVIARHTISLALEAGQGFLLSNSRWLHARTAFTGRRVMHRLIGDPLPGFDVPRGFLPTYPDERNRAS